MVSIIKMKLQLSMFFFLAAVHADFQKRIISGHNVLHGSFPNVVRVFGLKRTDTGVNFIFCTGVLYNEKWVTVNGNSIFGLRSAELLPYMRVIAGQWNHTQTEEFMQRRAVKIARKYEDTDKTQFGKSIDLGLLKVSDPFIFGPYVAAFPFSKNSKYPSGRVIIVGWGSATRQQVEYRRLTDIVQVIEEDVIFECECKEAIKDMLRRRIFFSQHNFNTFNFCTGTYMQQLRGISHGDEGSPVMQEDVTPDQYQVIGINSAGNPHINLAVHTLIAPFVQWIESEIASFPDL